jgi:hypothetical protein
MQGASERQGEGPALQSVITGDNTMFTMQDLRGHYRFTDLDAELLLSLVQKDYSKA